MATTPIAGDPLLAWRDEFPSLQGVLHFASHTLGAMPRGVSDALERYARRWRTRGIRAWEDEWFALPTETGNRLASLLGAAPGTVAMFENTTTAAAVALSAMPFAPPRNRLICLEEDFPSLLYLYEGLTRRGAEIVRIRSQNGRRIAEEDVAAAIDERTQVVAISAVLFRTSQKLDLWPIAERARAAGALTLIDAYQAVGTVPLDVRLPELDLVAGGSVKWLCGGPGAGYLYVSPRIAGALEPALTGWLAHDRPFDFDPGPTRRHTGARRFWTGTPGIPAYLAAQSGYDIVNRIGVTAIREKSLRQTGRMLALADDYGFSVGSPREPERRGGTVCLDVPDAERVCETLLAEDVLCDFRPGVGLRLAPHFYTRDDEVDRVMRRVRELVPRASG